MLVCMPSHAQCQVHGAFLNDSVHPIIRMTWKNEVGQCIPLSSGSGIGKATALALSKANAFKVSTIRP